VNRGNPTFSIGRREFFRAAARYLVLGAMTAIGILLARRGGIDRRTQRCDRKGVCCGCRTFDTCRLPAALSAKLAKAEGDAS